MESILNRTEQEVVPISIQWCGFAKDVRVLGEFSNWEPLTMSNEKEDKWNLTIKQRTGQFLLKFIVDGKYVLSEDLEKVIGSDQEVYNLLDVFPQYNGAQIENLNKKSVKEDKENQYHAALDDPMLKKLTVSNKTNDQSSNQTMEMDAVETLEKTLGVTNYVIQSKAEQMIPLIRGEDEQLTVFLATTTQPLTDDVDFKVIGQEEEIKSNVEIPLIRNPDDQLSVFLASNLNPVLAEQEQNVDQHIPLIRNPDVQLGVFLGNNEHSQHIEEQSLPI